MKMKSCFLSILGMGLIAAEVGAVVANSTEGTRLVPLIEAANVPLYPIAAQAARISGKVVLQISTNGKEVSTVEVKSGPAMLVQAAKENIATWHFKPGQPTTFEAIFQYRIVEPASCSYENGAVSLKLPTFAEITVNELQSCDPSSAITREVKK